MWAPKKHHVAQGASFCVFLAALLLLVLVEGLISSFQSVEFQECETLLKDAARKLEKASAPQTALNIATSRLIGGATPHFNSENAVAFAAKVTGTLGSQAVMVCFNSEGRAVFPVFSPAGQKNWEKFWRGIRLHIKKEKFHLSPAERVEFSAINTLAQTMFDPFIHLGYMAHSLSFQRYYERPGSGTVYFSTFPNCDKRFEDQGGLYLDIPARAVSQAFLFQTLTSIVPREVDWAVLKTSGTPVFLKISEEPLQGSLEGIASGPEGKLLSTSQGFSFLHPLAGSSSILVLGKRFSFFGSVSTLPRRLFDICFLLCSLWFSLRLGKLIAYPERANINLGKQIAASFFFASWVPLLALLYFGIGRTLEIDKLTDFWWHERMNRALFEVDNLFRNYQESLQVVGRKNCEKAVRLLNRRASLAGLLNADYRKTFKAFIDPYTFHQTTNRGKFRAGEFREKYTTGITLVARGIMTDIMEARGKLTGKSIRIKDFLGKQDPTTEIIKNFSLITVIQYAFNPVLVFTDLVEDEERNILGFLLLHFDLNKHAQEFFRVTRKRLEKHYAGIRLVALLPDRVVGDRIFVHPRLQYLGSLAKETGSQEEAWIGSGTEFLARAQSSRFFKEISLGCFIPGQALKAQKFPMILTVVSALVLGLLIIIGAILFLYRYFMKPIDRVTRAVARIAAEDYSVRLPVETVDEWGALSHAFNEMAGGLQERERMKRFVSDSVWDAAREEELKPKKLDVAVLFSDIRNFTTHSERETPQEIVSMLNDYFTHMDQIITRNHGSIDKLIGDAILAVFQPGTELDDPCARAVRAGLEMRQALAMLNNEREKSGRFCLDNGVGIAYGPGILGRVGSRSGRSDVTIVGTVTKHAADLESMSKHGSRTRVVVCPVVMAKVGERFPGEKLSADSLEGFEISAGEKGLP